MFHVDILAFPRDDRPGIVVEAQEFSHEDTARDVARTMLARHYTKHDHGAKAMLYRLDEWWNRKYITAIHLDDI